MNSILENIDKEQAFASLAEEFYKKNFGNLTKSEFELMMFKFYIEAAEKSAVDENGIIDETKISDYKIGFDLGITPTRVRNLRLKSELKFNKVFDWKSELSNVLLNPNNMRLSGEFYEVTVRSKYLFYAVEDWVEDRGGTLDITLNPKQLRIPKDKFFALLKTLKLVNDEQNAKALEEMQKSLKHEVNKANIIEFGLKALEAGESISNIIDNISPVFSPKSLLVSIIKNILNLEKNKLDCQSLE